MKWAKRKDFQQTTVSLEQQRGEKLAEMGSQLWALRQEQGLSLEEMVMLTRIPKRLLQAIEEGSLDDLPEPIYIQGLIRQFADALGLKGAEFASSFPIDQDVSRPTSLETPKIRQLRPIHLYLLYILVIVCSVSGLSEVLKNAALQANNEQSNPKQDTQSFVKPIPTQLTTPNQIQASTEAKVLQDGQPVQIGVTLKASSWIRVIADGKTQFEGTLPQGSHRTWKAQEQLSVKTDNAGGVVMSVNQKQAQQMGAPGTEGEIMIAAQPQS